MKTQAKNRLFPVIIGFFALTTPTVLNANAQSYSVKTNHSGTNLHTLPSQVQSYSNGSYEYPVENTPAQPVYTGEPQRNFSGNSAYNTRSRYGTPVTGNPSSYGAAPYASQPYYPNGQGQMLPGNGVKKYDGLMARLRGEKALSYQRPAPAAGPTGMFQQWVDYEPQYQFYPGDQIDIVVSSAPELSRTLTVGPDGRVSMPLVSPIMAAGRSIEEVQQALRAQLATQLVDPTVNVTPRAFAPAQVYVGGQVNAQGTYALPGPIGALEALIMAGGLQASAKTNKIAVLRRSPTGGMMMRSINVRNGMRNIREYNDNIQLKRGDIIFVPRTTLSEVGNFVQALRLALPVDLNVSYNIGNGGNNDTALTNNTTP